MTRRIGLTGISTNAPGLIGVRNTRRSIPLPAGSISRPESVLERGHVSQALLDISALLAALLVGLSVLLSVPLSIFLLLFASF
jgi:hypothetical protein